MTKIKQLLGDVILATVLPLPSETSSGIALPESQHSTKPIRVRIELIGQKVKDFGAEVGDIVYVSPYLGTDLELEGTRYKVYDTEDILCKEELIREV